MYTPTEISKVKALYQNLIELNLIRIEELDGFGEPIPVYTAEAERQLIAAITECKGFPWRCHLDNAAISMADLVEKLTISMSLDSVMTLYKEHLVLFALEELTESLFPKAELNSMLKDHPEYLDMVQDNVRRGLLLAEEMDDSAQRVSDMRAA
jgi:hypothetical protein